MGRKKLAQLLSFPIQICTKISTKILENIHSDQVSVKGINNSMQLLVLRVRLSPSLCHIDIKQSLFADSADTHSLQQTPINLSHRTYRCFGHQTKTISSFVSNCANILGDSCKKVLPLTSMVFYGTEIENLFLTVSQRVLCSYTTLQMTLGMQFVSFMTHISRHNLTSVPFEFYSTRENQTLFYTQARYRQKAC